MPLMPSLICFSFHAAKAVSLLRASSRALHLRVSSSSEAEMSSRGILPWDTSASSVEYEMSCSPSLASSPERTSTLPTDAAAERTDRAPALASDLAGDPLWDPLPLPDLELDPDELDELDRLPLDPRPDAELSLEEEAPDCDRCGEGDLACICAWRESILQAESWEEDLTMEVSRHFSRPGRVLWRSRRLE